MIASATLIRDYFAPPLFALWRWTADGRAIESSDGKTICFVQEIAEILTRLKYRGLPQFDAIVLLVTACRDGWLEQSELRNYLVSIETLTSATATQSTIKSLISRLDRVASFPPPLRTSISAKSFLIETIFETTERNIVPSDAELLVSALCNGILPSLLVSVHGSESAAGGHVNSQTFARTNDALRAIENLTAENLELRAKTGLDRLVIPAEDIDLPATQRVRKLIDVLRLDSDPELAGLGRLAQNLMAAVHVPRTLSPEDDLPLGGFSDIANRGPLDRLLSSELAHDDLTLAVRVALNEALYLRRESPPRAPPKQRALLLDSGIRMWGLPRVFCAGIALALSASADKRVTVQAFRALANTLAPVDLATRPGLLAHLAALETAAHPGGALKPFFDETQLNGSAADAILITHPDALTDPEFKAALAALPGLDFYAATADRDGTFRFFHITSSGQSLLREAKLPLKAILEPQRENAVPPDDKSVAADLPAILSITPFPLLIPHAVVLSRACRSPKLGVIAIEPGDGRLTQWTAPYRGPKQLSANVPEGEVLKLLIFNEAEALAVIREKSTARLLLYRFNVETSVESVREFPPNDSLPLEVRIAGDALVMIFSREIAGINLISGAVYEKYSLQLNLVWTRGGYFRRGTSWYALSLSLGKIRLDRVSSPPPGTIALIDREGLDGPWALTTSGALVSTVPHVSQTVQFPLTGNIAALEAVSVNGKMLKIAVAGTSVKHCFLNARRGAVTEAGNEADENRLLEPEIFAVTAPAPVLRTDFEFVGIAEDGRIILYSTAGYRFQIYLADSEKLMIKESVASPALRTNIMTFVPLPTDPQANHRLRVARFSDGSRIFFDSRGLLHLKSSDPTMPEISLVLNDRNVTGWSSDGKQFGLSYFIAAGDLDLDRTFDAKIKRFTQRLQ